MNQIVILSGKIGSGKTTLAAKLDSQFGFRHIKTRDFLKARFEELQLERAALQAFGEKLDRKTGGDWVVEDLAKRIREKPDQPVVLDSVRHPGQVDALRQAYGRKIIHIHLKADIAELETRYEQRQQSTDIKELSSYALPRRGQTDAV